MRIPRFTAAVAGLAFAVTLSGLASATLPASAEMSSAHSVSSSGPSPAADVI